MRAPLQFACSWIVANPIWQILIKDDTPAKEHGTSTIYSTVNETDTTFLTQPSISTAHQREQDYTFRTPRNADVRPRDYNYTTFQSHTHTHTHTHTNDDYSSPDGPADTFFDGESGNNDSQTKVQRQTYDKFAKRTIVLSNLPDATTHVDITDAVRGGMLLDIYLRPHDHTASVSFLEGSNAHEFFRHVKRHDLYIRGKRVSDVLRWLIYV